MKTIIQNFLLLTFILSLSAFTQPTLSYSILSVDNETEIFEVGGAYLVFAGKYNGEIKKSEIANQKELGVEGCAKGSRIFKFTLEVKKNGALSTMYAESNLLTNEMLTKLKSLSTGDTFEFKALKAYSVDHKDVIDVHGGKFTVV